MTRKVPTELSSASSLTSALGIGAPELQKIFWFRDDMYHRAVIRKRAGGKRYLYCPDDRLKFIQRRLLELLSKIYSPRLPVHGFARGRSVKTNAESHLNRDFILTIDLKDFFPTITEPRVTGALRAIGLPRESAELIARISCRRGQLPQGAPTSPILSNIVCYTLDTELMAFSRVRRIRYTRYADDLAFSCRNSADSLLSGPRSPGRLTIKEVSSELVETITNNGFSINDKKIRFYGPRSRKIVTGILLGERTSATSESYRIARNLLYDIEARGYCAAQSRFKATKRENTSLYHYLRGLIEWIGFVNERDENKFRRLAKNFNKTFPYVKPISFLPSSEDTIAHAVRVIEQGSAGPKKPYRQGTAFYVNKVGWITAEHCVDLKATPYIFLPGGLRVAATVLTACKHRDLAVLSVPGVEGPGFRLSRLDPRKGDHIRALGFPNFGPGDTLTERAGTVSSSHTKSAVRRFDVSTKLSGGMSGGPILNSKSEVVGVIHKGGAGEERDMGISVSELESWLKAEGVI